MEARKKAKNTPEYEALNKEIKKSCKAAKEEWFNKKCDDIEHHLNVNGTKKMHDCIKEIAGVTKSSSSTGCIKDKNGNMLFEGDKVLERWAEYVGELFDDARPDLPIPSNDRGPPILRCEVEKAISNSQLGKAPGDDGITTEMLRLLEDFGIDKLTELFNEIYSTGVYPDELLLMSVYTTLPKQPTATECSNFRTISLMAHTLKIFLKVIQARIGTKIDAEVGPTQFGFRPGSGTREGIFCYNILAQKHIEVDKDMYTCFIDYSKAFDRVHHNQLIKCLEKIGIDGRDIRVITNLYWHQKAAIRIQDQLSPLIPIKRGVRQGCVLSPYLFNIYTEFIFRESNELKGITIHGQNINNLRYADDTALVADSVENLQKVVDKVKEVSSRGGLEMNVKKTKTMITSRKPENKSVEIKVDNETLQQVLNFIYLGAEINQDIRSDKEIERRCNIAKEKFSKIANLLTSKKLKITTKLRIVKC